MNVLVACEESQRVMKAFRDKGHNAFSCDLKDCSGGYPQFHIKGDAREVIDNGCWDLIIAHPPCTYLANSGACNMYRNGVIDEERFSAMIDAREFFMYFYNLDGVKVCIENPKPFRLAGLPMHTQTVQPFEFGDNYSKLTLLWLKGLPPLIPLCYGQNRRTIEGVKSWCLVHSDSTNRAKTFNGIALAMANQWG